MLPADLREVLVEGEEASDVHPAGQPEQSILDVQLRAGAHAVAEVVEPRGGRRVGRVDEAGAELDDSGASRRHATEASRRTWPAPRRCLLWPTSTPCGTGSYRRRRGAPCDGPSTAKVTANARRGRGQTPLILRSAAATGPHVQSFPSRGRAAPRAHRSGFAAALHPPVTAPPESAPSDQSTLPSGNG